MNDGRDRVWIKKKADRVLPKQGMGMRTVGRCQLVLLWENIHYRTKSGPVPKEHEFARAWKGIHYRTKSGPVPKEHEFARAWKDIEREIV